MKQSCNMYVCIDSEDSRMREIESILAAENSRLRAELERLHQQPQPIIIQQPAQVQFTAHTYSFHSLRQSNALGCDNSRISTLIPFSSFV